MFIYNVTFKVSWNAHDKWLEWLRSYHIPAIMEYNSFSAHKLLKLHNLDESDGATYALQLFADSKADYNRYVELHANEVATIEQRFWGMEVFSFSTLMEIVD